MSTSDFIAARVESKNAQRERAALGLMIAIVNLAREIKKCQNSGDLVRRITISATGEGIDSTTDSVNGLGDAFDNVSKKSQNLVYEPRSRHCRFRRWRDWRTRWHARLRRLRG